MSWDCFCCRGLFQKISHAQIYERPFSNSQRVNHPEDHMPSPIMWDLVSQLDRKELPCKWLWVSDLPPASALPRHLSPPIPTSIHLSFILRPHSPPPYPSTDLHTAYSLQHSEFTKAFAQRYNHPWSDTDCVRFWMIWYETYIATIFSCPGQLNR